MSLDNLPKNKKIILFDGVCNLCDSSVQFIIKNDSKDTFRFAAIQSEIGQAIIKHINLDIKLIDSIILYEPGIAYYVKAEAALIIARNLKGIYQIIGYLNFLPKGFKNTIYDHIAKNRYKWYGKKEACMIPTPELKSKFL